MTEPVLLVEGVRDGVLDCVDVQDAELLGVKVFDDVFEPLLLCVADWEDVAVREPV